MVDDIAEYYEPLAEASGLTPQVATGPAVEISGNRDLLFQALANLVDNAIKYTPSPGHVELRLSNQDQTPTIEVEDSGPGIVHKARDRVLKRFVRLDESRTTPGNGLGLSLVAAVAKLHRAKLELAGERGLLVKMVFTTATSGPPCRTQILAHAQQNRWRCRLLQRQSTRRAEAGLRFAFVWCYRYRAFSLQVTPVDSRRRVVAYKS